MAKRNLCRLTNDGERIKEFWVYICWVICGKMVMEFVRFVCKRCVKVAQLSVRNY